jgi:hypothetical protein
VATGLGLTLGLLLTTFVAVTLLDLATPLWPWLRLAALLLVVLPATWVFAVGVVVPLFRRLSAGQVARRIEAHLPGIHNRLVSCVDLAAGARKTVLSPAFYRRLVAEALERIRNFRPRAVVDFISLRRAGLFAAAGSLALILAWAIFSDRLPTAMARILSPFADIPPASGVVYSVTPGDATLLRGEEIAFNAFVEKGEPDRLTLELFAESGRKLTYDLQKKDADLWSLTLGTGNLAPGFERGFAYRVRGGGTWSKEYHVRLLERPVITDLHTVLHYAEYLGMPEPRVGPSQVADVTGPEGSEVEVVVEVEGDVAKGEIQLLQPGATPARSLSVTNRFPLHPGEERKTWSGRFPLIGEGLYRVELRNEIGYANQTMKEGKYQAIPDRPPQVVLQRPGSDLSVSEPGKVPLVVAAYDDFGLADVTLLVKKGDQGGFSGQPLKQYAVPARSDVVQSALDLAPFQLKPGEHIRYAVQARDRKGQIAQTPEFVIRLVGDKSGADQQLEALARSEENLGAKLPKLIGQQAGVLEAVQKLNAKHAPLVERIEAARAKAEEQAAGAPAGRQPREPQLPPRELDALRQDLAGMAGQEQQNAQLGQEIAAELKQAAEQTARQPLVPPAVAEQATNLQQLFQHKAAQPLQELAAQMNQGKDPNRPAPDVRGMQSKAERVQKELEAMKDRLRALAEAEKGARDQGNEGLARLQQKMLEQDARLTERDLGELRDFMQGLRRELKGLGDNEEQLLSENETGKKPLPRLEKDQAGLEKQAEKPLRQTRGLQASDQMKKLRHDLQENNDQNEANQAAAGNEPQNNQPEESAYKPALGGRPPQSDPRFTPKERTTEQRNDSSNPEERRRADLGNRQRQEGQKLSAAEQSLAADQQSLDRLLERLERAAQSESGQSSGKAQSGQPAESGQEGSAENLGQLLHSSELQRANAMAARLRQMSSGRGTSGQGQSANRGSESPIGSLQGGPRLGGQPDPALDKLDPETRSLILKMQPKLRDELLQGLREEGPEGYRPFIQDYFKRLSKEKGPR